jgi:hypothetical protein
VIPSGMLMVARFQPVRRRHDDRPGQEDSSLGRHSGGNERKRNRVVGLRSK